MHMIYIYFFHLILTIDIISHLLLCILVYHFQNKKYEVE